MCHKTKLCLGKTALSEWPQKRAPHKENNRKGKLSDQIKLKNIPEKQTDSDNPTTNNAEAPLKPQICQLTDQLHQQLIAATTVTAEADDTTVTRNHESPNSRRA
jgi:hypothetical protein